MTRAGLNCFLVALLLSTAASGQDSESNGEAAANDQETTEAAPAAAPGVPAARSGAQAQPTREPVETTETFVPTEDISEDRSVSFPVDI